MTESRASGFPGAFWFERGSVTYIFTSMPSSFSLQQQHTFTARLTPAELTMATEEAKVVDAVPPPPAYYKLFSPDAPSGGCVVDFHKY